VRVGSSIPTIMAAVRRLTDSVLLHVRLQPGLVVAGEITLRAVEFVGRPALHGGDGEGVETGRAARRSSLRRLLLLKRLNIKHLLYTYTCCILTLTVYLHCTLTLSVCRYIHLLLYVYTYCIRIRVLTVYLHCTLTLGLHAGIHAFTLYLH